MKQDLSRIVGRYCVANVDGDGHVDADYRRLHNELEDPTFLELSGPPSNAGAHEPPKNRRAGAAVIVGAEGRDPLAHVIRCVAERRVRLKEFFVDYDRLRSGFCTRAQFLVRRVDREGEKGGGRSATVAHPPPPSPVVLAQQRVLHVASIPDISEADMEALADHYWDPARLMVRYQEFVGDVEKVSPAQRTAWSAQLTCMVPHAAPTLPLAPQAFTIPSLEKDPKAPVETEQRRIAERRRGVGAPDLTEAERERAEVLVANIRERVAHRRIQMKDKFRDFDRHRTQTVTRDRFRRVMAIAGLVPSNALPREDDLFVLQRYYQAEGRPDAVQYAAFLRDIGEGDADLAAGASATFRSDALGPLKDGGMSHLALSGQLAISGHGAGAGVGSGSGGGAGRPAAAATAGALSLADLLARIRQYAVQNRVHPGAFLADYDKLRHGRCTRAQFSAGVRAAFPFLRTPMVETLQGHYVDAAATDPAGHPYVAWRQFADDVEIAFTKKVRSLTEGGRVWTPVGV